MEAPIMIDREAWMASQLSVARHAGGCRAWGREYLVSEQTGDLVRRDFLALYRRLGRPRFTELLRQNPALTDAQLKRLMHDALRADRTRRQAAAPKQGDLFGGE